MKPTQKQIQVLLDMQVKLTRTLNTIANPDAGGPWLPTDITSVPHIAHDFITAALKLTQESNT